jgi:ABC-type multidrug transport system fused ATPase/permease subunit
VDILKRLIRFLKPYWRRITLIMVLVLSGIAVDMVPPLVQKTIIDEILGQQNLRWLASLVAMLAGLYFLQQLINIADSRIRHTLGARFILDLRVHLYSYLQKLSLSFFERTSTGELMARSTNDVNSLENFITHGVSFILLDVLRLVAAAVILLFLDYKLALLVFIPIPIMAVSLRVYNKKIRPMYRKIRDRMGVINARLQDSLAGVRVVQAFGQEERELERFRIDSEAYYQAEARSIRTWGTFFPTMNFVASFGTLIVLGMGGWLVVRSELSVGGLVAFISYLHILYSPVYRLVEADNVFQDAIAAGSRIFELLDQKPEITNLPDAIELPQMKGEVVFNDVSFSYSTGDEVLHGVSFHISPGETVALVGPSGAGKTSIAGLLCRFYDPQSGKITIDGFDLTGVKLGSLRKQIAVVLQDTFLFNTTIRENLLYGKPDATEEEVVAAARVAYAHDFIMSLPNGYDTEVGERGVKLSGGQKQRLALARAILMDPRILILDEATSSVDAEAEYLIQQALEAVLKGRTALVIAHRLSTIRDADKIIALEGGHIVEVGDHKELMKRGGLYSQLYKRQLELNIPGEESPSIESIQI